MPARKIQAKNMKQIFSKQVIARGKKMLVGNDVLLLNRRIRLDMRFTENKKVAAYMKDNPLIDSEKKTILYKRKQRRYNKPSDFKNVLQNPLLLDFRRNGGNVFCDRLNIDGRNHWAKKPIDFKVLEILMRNQYAKRMVKAS